MLRPILAYYLGLGISALQPPRKIQFSGREIKKENSSCKLLTPGDLARIEAAKMKRARKNKQKLFTTE